MNRDEAMRLLHAYVDGELDLAVSLELEAALAAEPALRAAHERLRAMSALIREKAAYHAAPAGFAERMAASLPQPDRAPRLQPASRRRWFAPAVAFAGVALLAFGISFSVMQEGHEARLEREILASHARATLGNRMIDIASSDRHTVKPWLSARLAFSPPVEDFAAAGFPLAGGRLDYIEGGPVAVLVYHRRKHTAEVFVWPGDTPTYRESRDGLNTQSFTHAGMSYWLVSDIPRNELGELARLLAASGA